MRFSANFVKFVRIPSFIEQLRRLLLNFDLTHISPMFPLSVLNYVPRMFSCPTYLTCLCALRAYVFTRPTRLRAPLLRTCLPFLRALHAFLFFRVLRAFIFYVPLILLPDIPSIFYVPYVPLLFYVPHVPLFFDVPYVPPLFYVPSSFTSLTCLRFYVLTFYLCIC